MSQVENARVVRCDIIIDDHGLLTLDLCMEGPGWTQSFASCRLDGMWSPDLRHSVGHYLRWLLAALEKDSLRAVVGTPCRVRRNEPFGPIVAVGHYLKDQWFEPTEAWWKESA